MDVVDLLARTTLVASRSEARRLLGEGGIRINGVPVAVDHLVTDDALLHGHWLVLRRGKQRYELVRAAQQ